MLKHELSIRYVNYCKKILTFFSASIRRSGKNMNFEDKKINKLNFCKNKKILNIYDLDVNKILVSKKESFIGQKLHWI